MDKVNFSECVHYGQCDEIDRDLKWIRIIGWALIASMISMGSFVLMKAEESAELRSEHMTYQKAVTEHIRGLTDNIQLLNKNIGESSLRYTSSTLDTIIKQSDLETKIAETQIHLKQHLENENMVLKKVQNIEKIVNRNLGRLEELSKGIKHVAK